MTFRSVFASVGSLRPVVAAFLVGSAGLMVGCGGGGNKVFEISTNAISITSTAIVEPPNGPDVNSQFESADGVDWEVPLQGGCGGPYVLTVVSGALPPGISAVGGLDGVTPLHHLRGTLLQHGTFNFRLQVTDTACSPFEFTSADFTWTVSQGQVKIVASTPDWFEPGTYDPLGQGVKNPLYHALPDSVFNSNNVFEFTIAGGVPPYTLDVVDDPNNPDDSDGLPQGIVIAGRSIVGSPQSIKDGQPFIFSLVVTDGNGQMAAPFPVQWEITAPPIVFLDDMVLPSGKCGEPYFHAIGIKDGVPPFNFELVQTDVLRDVNGDPDVTYQSPMPPIITPASAATKVTAAAYPAAAAMGPDYRANRVPPEGVRMGDNGGNTFAANGALAGTPRRRGQFSFYVHVFSTTAGTSTGQHNWKYFEMSTVVSEPPNLPKPAFGQDPKYTLTTTAFSAVQPYNSIADAEQGVATYNPDSVTHSAPGLQLLALGGVRKDGLTDAPHGSQVSNIDGLGVAQEDGTTVGGGYDWSVNPNPAGDGDIYSTLPPGMTLDGHLGVWRIGNAALLKGQQNQALEFTCSDQQLPTPLRNVSAQRVNFAVGPDKVIITESSTSGTSSTSTAGRRDHNDDNQTVRVLLPYSVLTPVVRNLDSTLDMTATHTVPSTTGIAAGSTNLHTLLSGQDLMRVCVSATGWWNDVSNLNPLGARSGIHGDNNMLDLYYYGENDFGGTSDYSRQPASTAVALPAYRPGAFNAVSHAPLSGVFTDGGRLYPFANNNYFGVFIIRSDSSIYVPFAIGTGQTVDGQTFNGFGDNQVVNWAAVNNPSQARALNMAVSPDGRFAAVKIKNSATNYTETAQNSRIVIFSLTGEKAFGGQTWTVVKTGSIGNSTQGSYLYGASLALTNSHLYYICGNRYGTFTTASASREHFIYRFPFADPTTGAVTAGATGTGSFCPAAVADAQWTNTTSAPMMTRFQMFYNSWNGSQMMNSALTMDAHSVTENAVAPIPFRVSADGRACGILAAPDVVANSGGTILNTTSSVTPLAEAWHVWVDFNGAGVRRLSSAPLHVTGGSARGYVLGRGTNNNNYESWHTYGGPTSQFELSDDATKVAVVANRFAGNLSTLENTYSFWAQAREDVIFWRTSTWTSWTEVPVTGNNAGTNIFSSSNGAMWRFGALTFTANNAGLVFWGGYSQWWAASTSISYQYNHQMGGTMYGVDISTASAITGLTVTALLAQADGGASAGITSYTTSSQYNPTLPGGTLWDASGGAIKPLAGFISRNRNFMYLMNKSALFASGADHQVVGINIRSTNTATSINGRTDFRGFALGGWPVRRGFQAGTYAYYPAYGMYYTDYPGHRKQGCAKQMMPKNNGWVFFVSQYQQSGPAYYNTYYLYGGAYQTYSYDYSSLGGEVEAFNADVGGNVQRISAHASDTTIRRIRFIEVADSGDAVAYVTDNGQTLSYPHSEQLHMVVNVSLSPTTGALTATPTRVAIESAAGRVSDSIAFGSKTNRLYYGYGSTTNENAKSLKEVTVGPGTSTAFRTMTGTTMRYNVLFGAR